MNWEIGEERFWLTTPTDDSDRALLSTDRYLLDPDRGAEYLVPIDTDDGMSVALVYDDDYARLIRAAPEMRRLLVERPSVSLSGQQYTNFCAWQDKVDALLKEITP